jgi:hypothetical protein
MTVMDTTTRATEPPDTGVVPRGGAWLLAGAATFVGLASGVARLLGS